MALFYTSPYGSDSNNGLGPDPTAATNKPWLTVGKSLENAANIASGDTVYFAPGTYRETTTITLTSPTGETSMIGDTSNSRGFKDGSGVLVPGGPVIWTAHPTNDTTAATAASLINLNGRDFLTFEGIYMKGGNTANSVIEGSTSHSTNITLRKCYMEPYGATNAWPVRYVGLADTAAAWLFDRCVMVGGQLCMFLEPTTSASADYDLNFRVENCLLIGNAVGQNIYIQPSGAGAFKPGGIHFRGCGIYYGVEGIRITNANFSSTTFPMTVKECHIKRCSAGLTAAVSGQILETYNRLHNVTDRTNVTAGTGSQAGSVYSDMPSGLYDLITELSPRPRPFWAPMAGSPLLNFGNDTSPPATDISSKPRLSGLTGDVIKNTPGAFGRHDLGLKETATTDANGVGLVIPGPGVQDFSVPVNAGATVISVRASYDTTHSATLKPQAVLLANPEIGVTLETLTMSAAANTWETLTFASQTPTAKGYVTVRLVSRSASISGKAFFDTAVTPDIDTGDFAHYNRGEPLPVLTGAGSGGGAIGHGRLSGGLQ